MRRSNRSRKALAWSLRANARYSGSSATWVRRKLRLGALAEHVIHLGQCIDVEVHPIMLEHRQDALAALDFAEGLGVRQVAAVVVAAYPRQAVLADGVQGWHRLAGKAQGIDMVHVEVPAWVKVVFVLILVRADPGIGLAALDQPNRTAVRRALRHHLHPRWLEHLAQHVPGDPAAIGVGVVEPLFTDQMDLLRRPLRRRHPRGKAKHHCQQHSPYGHQSAPCLSQPPTPEPAYPARQRHQPGYRRA